LPGGGEGALSLNSGEWTYAADGTTQVRAASKPPTTKITGDANWDDIAVTSRFEADANYTVCFVPGEDCEGVIVAEINQARSVVLVQAYSFTSMPIAKALVSAKQRGVSVQVILDKSQRSERYSGATLLANAGIRTLIDEQPSIAHSKVIIIDGVCDHWQLQLHALGAAVQRGESDRYPRWRSGAALYSELGRKGKAVHGILSVADDMSGLGSARSVR